MNGDKESLDNAGGLRLVWLLFIKEYVANNGNATEAYLKTHKGVSRETARRNGARLLTNADIREEINCRYDQQRATEAWIISNLMFVAKNPGRNPMAAVKALETLARIKGMLTDTKKVEFTAENPAVFLPLFTKEESEEFRKMSEKSRICE